MTMCWENPENANKLTTGCKPKLNTDKVKKRMMKAIACKTEVHGAYVETKKSHAFMWISMKKNPMKK